MAENKWDVKELSYKSKAKKPFALTLNGKVCRTFYTEERALAWKKHYKKSAKFHKPKGCKI
jgi:hypothetical protein